MRCEHSAGNTEKEDIQVPGVGVLRNTRAFSKDEPRRKLENRILDFFQAALLSDFH